jgi:hypothetical protein
VSTTAAATLDETKKVFPSFKEAMDARAQTTALPTNANGLDFVGNYNRTLPNAKGVDPRLTGILQDASSNWEAQHPGYSVQAFSGERQSMKHPGSQHNTWNGADATDVQILDPNGQKLGNYQDAASYRQYESFAQQAKLSQEKLYPNMGDNDLRWGGYFSGAKNYGAVDTMHFDLGGEKGLGMLGGSWEGGMTAKQRRLWPGATSIGMKDQNLTTNSVPASNTSMKDADAALNQAMPNLDKLKTSVTDIGQKSLQSSTQVDQGLQQTTTASQTNATAMQTASTSVQMAGTNAQQASPNFQQAGQSLQDAGQKAQMAGQAAQTANPGLSGMSNGINSLVGPLTSAIPSLGTFSSVLSSLGSLGSPGVGLFKEGGMSGSPVQMGAVSMSSFANAPHFAEGTPNTSGGMPAILHPNEAVIPLSRGREIPVKIDSTEDHDYKTEYGQRQNVGAPTVQMIFQGVKNGDDFKRSKRQAQAMVADGMQQAHRRNS